MTEKVFFEQPPKKSFFGFELDILPSIDEFQDKNKINESISIENLENLRNNLKENNDEKINFKTNRNFLNETISQQSISDFAEFEKDELLQMIGYENFTKSQNFLWKFFFINHLKLLSYIKKTVYNKKNPKKLSIIDFPLISEPEEIPDYLEKLKQKLYEKNQKITKLFLFKSMFSVFKKEIIIIFVKNIIFVGMVSFNSMALNFLLDAAGNGYKSIAFVWSAVVIFVLFFRALILHNSQLETTDLSTKLRLVIICLLYSKLEKISFYNAQKANLGKIINIISGDMNTLEIKILFLMFLICTPMTVIFVFGLLTFNFGFLPSLVSLSPIIFILFLIMFLQKSNEIMYKNRNHFTDERIKLANETIEGIRLIKMYGWERSFKEFIDNIRNIELKKIFRINLVNFFDRTIGFNSNYLLSFLLFISFYYLGNNLTIGLVFSAIQLFDFFRKYVFLMFGYGFQMIFEVKVILQRIIDFLEIDEEKNPFNKEILSQNIGGEIAIKLSNYEVYWNEMDFKNSKPILKNLSPIFYKNKTYAIIGKVGSGKTTFLYTLLRELPFSSGEFLSNPSLSVAYVEQEPFIMAATIRANILFGKPMNIELYKEVLDACALQKDLLNLENSDLTEVGEKGTTLSGGQKARISLARALYSEADIYLLDDPLSAIDVKVVRHVFNKAIKGKMKEKCVILVTHQIQFIEEVDEVILLNNKTIEKQGKPELFSQIIDEFSKKNEELLNELKDNQSKNTYEPFEIKIDNVYTKALILQKQLKNKENKMSMNRKSFENLEISDILNNKNQLYQEEFHGKGEKTIITFFKYLKKIRSFGFIFLTILLFSLTEIARFGVTFIFGLFGNYPSDKIFLYTGLLILAFLIFSYLKFHFLSYIILKGNNHIHNEMFHRIIRTSIEFFDCNPSGRIMNRFSNDMNLMDNIMVMQFADLLDMLFFYVSMNVAILVVSPYFLIAVFVFVITYYLAIRYFYDIVRDSKNLDLSNKSPIFALFASTVQGLLSLKVYKKYSYFHKKFINLVHKYARANYMHYRITRTFAFVVDMFSITFIAISMFLFILQIEDTTYLGLCLVFMLMIAEMIQWLLRQIIVIMTLFTSVERCLSFTNLKSEGQLRKSYDSHIISNPKILKDDKWDKQLSIALNNTDEIPLYLKISLNKTTIALKQDWPQHGGIIFNNIFMKYRKNTPFVLQGLSFSITPGEKIGCVGRTGAGKSSLTQVLFRLSEIEGREDSSLKIDGVDIRDIGLHTLRHSISIIPQNPFVFSGTIRRNLDPLNEYSEEQLWKVLEDVDLKNVVDAQIDKLNTDMTNSNQVFSAGQKQLICLARAILKNNKILILDEATANVDIETDKFIQKKIKEKFSHCTILTIAHRLLTIANSDKVIVLEKGVCKEFEEPFKLLVENINDTEITKNSYFSELVKNAGENISKEIFSIAKEKYMEKNYK